MIKGRWVGVLLPAGLGLAGIALLIRVSIADHSILLPSDLDVMIMILGLSLAIFASINLVVREILERLRRQSVEEARRQAFAEHRRFLNRLDHELKNPITAMRAGLGSLSMALTTDQQRTLLRNVEAETVRLSQLVTSLRRLAELETISVEAHPIDTQVFFNEILELEREQIEAGQRDFKLEPPAQWPVLIGDQDLLLLALHNLLDNAFKYTRPGDRIRLRVRVEDDDLVIEIEDSGMGIDEAEMPMVWEELYRSRRTRDIPGSGIGLALVKAIIERHDGEVSLTSQPNVGTVVTVRLPLT
jgi:two-component system OmpR family sensor kinase